MIIGVYTITYNVSDNAGNDATEITRTVNVVDTTPPSAPSISSPTNNQNLSINTFTTDGTCETGANVTISNIQLQDSPKNIACVN